jgi:xanthine dehydrogenase iron-sulfur cluster and FAD-binding subunit A
MIMSVVALLAEHPDPDEETIRTWLGGNLCRCTGYNPIVAAVREAALRLPAPYPPPRAAEEFINIPSPASGGG